MLIDYESYIGKKFGKLTILSKEDKYYHCKCDCGKNIKTRMYLILNNKSKSCGCLRSPVNIGQKYSKLTIVEKVIDRGNGRRVYWKCLCECGNITEVTSGSLTTKQIQSCGCLRKQYRPKNRKWVGEIPPWFWNRILNSAELRKIEISITIEYIWNLFLKQNRRCALSNIPIHFMINKNRAGITASLDRIDNTKGYIEGNVQWVHKEINIMKHKHSDKEFINWCKLVAKHKG